MSEKSQSIKFKAKDQSMLVVLINQILRKQPSIRLTNAYFKRWRINAKLLGKKTHQQQWQNEKLATVMREKQDLERKVEFQNEANE